jgi:hypothetical protein
VNANLTNPINYLTNGFGKPFTEISWQYASTYEVENIIKSLKTKKIHMVMMKSPTEL